ncbi:endolytic transglycosylase MltG [Saccharopolyspora endophytica]|uniref:Endolytic murein transglycosylase n=1 Tax=Saccharopolyspora endophytica TaxID=543886 RepID=A0ABS5DJY2_9PSEU|nr:endolytic transglycosylase MltG [Saccharopolyspora endophytica]MBQ0926600.1 endolytic transglycosylase MltG [Saccharopolyspora endophytica]
MTDDLGLFADEPGDHRRRRPDPERFRRRKRRRWVTALAGLFVLVLVGGGVGYGALQIMRIGGYEDYDGEGTGSVVIEVASGDTVGDIGKTLSEKDVVASTKAFTSASAENKRINSIQPGYYLMRNKMSGKAAVSHILSAEAKVGRVDIRGGMRLEDQAAPNGGNTPGILTRLAEATCANKNEKCTTSEEMHTAAETADLATLGVPEWAVADASKAEPRRRLEGLIMPGIYDVKPGESAENVLRDVVTKSAAQLEAAGLPDLAESSGHSPYELMVIASLTQSEGLEKDFPKIARVIENRLGQPAMKLGLDSTINYPLDKPTLLTNSSDRQRPGPYNTYLNYGLPPTPISAFSKEALRAAERPAEGEWRYFVKCYPDGTSCFAKNQQEHDAFIKEAQERGAF